MRTVYATVLEVRESSDIETALRAVGNWIHNWYRRKRVKVDIQMDPASGDVSIEPAVGHLLTLKHRAASTSPGISLIDIKWSYPDQYDKSLGWVVSLALHRSPEGLLVSLDLAVTGLQLLFAPAKVKLGSPRLVREISRLRSIRISSHPYSATPELIGAEEVESLVNELKDGNRPYPIVLVSRKLADDRPLVDTSALAEQVAGVAKVYEMADKWAAFRLTEILTKSFSCYGGAIRIYWPRFNVEVDPNLHPLWMPWQLDENRISELTLQDIASRIFDAAAFRHVESKQISAIRHASEREQRETIRNQSNNSAEALLEDLIKVEEAYSTLQEEHGELLKEAETLRMNAMALAAHSSRLPALSSASSPQPSDDNSTQTDGEPKNMKEAVTQAELNAISLIFLPSAFESAEASPFRNPERALQALTALDEVASLWVKGLSNGEPIGSLRKLFDERGFTYKADVSQTSKGKWSAEYEASFEGRTVDISPHITIGAKQADSCLSVHWAWDEAGKRAIVAHVGRHKTNTKT